jgi:hypothetical protein
VKWVDVGWQANGVIAIGQVATGVVAFGQVAWGVVAVGQAAFGWLAVGQVAVGGITVGMVGVGAHATAAMIGVGGRGKGYVVPLLPSLDLRAPPVDARPLDRVEDGGWTKLHLVPRDRGLVAVFDGTVRVPGVRVDARCRRAALDAAPGDVWARLRRDRRGWVIERLVRARPPRWARPGWWLVWAAQLAGSLLLAALLWWLVVEPVLGGLADR